MDFNGSFRLGTHFIFPFVCLRTSDDVVCRFSSLRLSLSLLFSLDNISFEFCFAQNFLLLVGRLSGRSYLFACLFGGVFFFLLYFLQPVTIETHQFITSFHFF